MMDNQDLKFQDKLYLAHKRDRAENTDKLSKKLDELKPEYPVKVSIEGAELLTIKGEKGEKGDTGERGEQGIRGEIGPQGIPGQDSTIPGPKGDKGDRGEKGEPGADSSVPGPQGERGLPGKDGKDGKILKKIDVKDIKGLDSVLSEAGNSFLQQAKGFVPRALKSLYDVEANDITNGQSLIWNASKQKFKPGTAGSGSGQVNSVVAGTGISVDSTDPANPIVTNTGIAPTWNSGTPTGAIDDSNTIYTIPTTPATNSLFLFLNGQFLTDGGIDYTLSGANITMVTPPAAGSVLTYRYQ